MIGDTARLDTECNFLFDEIIDIIFEKLSILLNKNDNLLHIGCRNNRLADLLQHSYSFSEEKLFCCGVSYERISKIEYGRKVVLDEEFLPFMEETFDVIVSTMSLHCINKLTSVFLRINNILKKDGVFIGTLFGPQTLNELQQSVLNAELKLGLARPITIPFISIVDAANSLRESEFTNPVLDVYDITVKYKSILSLFRDLKSMVEANILHIGSNNFLSKSMFAEIKKFYINDFTQDDTCIPATFEVIIIQATKSKR